MGDESDSPPVVGVVGDADGSVARACRAAGGNTRTGDADAVLDSDPRAVVAVDETGLRAVALADPGVPVLPVEAGRGVRSVPSRSVERALGAVLAGEATVDAYPLIAVSVGDDRRALALFDAMLVTAEPAHISEFRVTHDGEPVARFRADGVVAATPAGTPGYASGAGSPVVPAGPDICTVEPIAPFATSLDDWVLPTESVGIEVLREQADVDLVVDGERVCAVGVGAPVSLSAHGSVSCYRVVESRSPFGPRDGEWEKL